MPDRRAVRLAFAGTPDFARTALLAILAAGHEVGMVLTQPDRAAGRGLRQVPSAVRQAAAERGIPVLQPRSLRIDGRYPEDAAAAHSALRALAPDAIVVAAYGLILPQWVLDLPRHGCLNIHASLLPRWRGAAPIQRAIEAGDALTGVTIMQMDAGLDTGAMIEQASCAIAHDETAATLHDRLAQLGAQTIVRVLARLAAGEALSARAQPAEGACYAAKLARAESALDFSLPAVLLERRIRAFDPFPGTTMQLPGISQPVKVWSADAVPAPELRRSTRFGDVLAVSPAGIDVTTADGLLRIRSLQRPGGRRQPVAEFVRGWQLPA